MLDFRIICGKEKLEKRKLFQIRAIYAKIIRRKLLMLTKCVNCGFYVRQTDEFCLNCGFLKPAENLEQKSFNYKRFAVIALPLFAITFLLMMLIDAPHGEVRSPLIIAYLALSISLVFAILSTELKAILDKNKKLEQRKSSNRDNLTTKNVIIEKRVSELNKRGQKIDVVLDKIKETDGENLQEVRQKLLSAREIVMSQFARYELQKQKIELVRLQNNVSPFLFSLHHLNELETENGLVTIENTQSEINRIRRNLTVYAPVEFPKRTLPEKENFLAQLDETEDSCEKLREALLSRQAARALQDISPIEENLKLPSTKEIIHAAESFNIQTTLTDFSESFEELEHEYKRLKAEEEMGQKLLES